MKIGLKILINAYFVVLTLLWSVSALAVPPQAATLVGPTGQTNDPTPTYVWNAVANSTWYYLWISDVNGIQLQTWYTSAQAGCPAGTGTCSITPTNAVTGTSRFWVRTWNNDGNDTWSAQGLFTVTTGGPPAAPALIAPTGTVLDTTPTYSWNASPGSTWYMLWVQDPGGVKIQTWYTQAQVGCVGGTGTCSITPATALQPGTANYWVRGYNALGNGPWSAAGPFVVSMTDPNTVPCNAPNAEVQSALLAAINTLRSTPTICNGVSVPAAPPLAWDTALGDSAQAHSDDMAANNYFSHTGQNGSTFSTRAIAAGYTGFANGENLAAGSGTVGGAISNWLGSQSGHCEGLMTTNSNEMGAACGFNPNAQWTNYWTFVSGQRN